MKIYYYLTVYPTEALIASQLEPSLFGTYMATGTKTGSFEKLIFFNIEGDFGDDFDWEYARKKCVNHEDGKPKNSVYLSVYRTLERVPLQKFGELYLTTRDGRSLRLDREEYSKPGDDPGYWLYQELCPTRPLITTGLSPELFVDYITSGKSKIYVPRILFADLKVIDVNAPDKTGNVGSAYDRNLAHLADCIEAVTSSHAKTIKTVDRSYYADFSYQVIQHAMYLGSGKNIIMYRMKSPEELRRNHYEWGRSALIL